MQRPLEDRLDDLGAADGRLLRMILALGVRVATLEVAKGAKATSAEDDGLEEMIGVKEAAWRLRCSPTSIRKRMANGTIVWRQEHRGGPILIDARSLVRKSD